MARISYIWQLLPIICDNLNQLGQTSFLKWPFFSQSSQQARQSSSFAPSSRKWKRRECLWALQPFYSVFDNRSILFAINSQQHCEKIGPGLEQVMQIKNNFEVFRFQIELLFQFLEQFNSSWIQRLKLVLDQNNLIKLVQI